MPNVAAELVISRNEFYQSSYQQIKLIVFILLLITALLIGFSIYQRKSLKPLPKYFPTTPDGRLVQMPPVNINHLVLSKQTVNPTTGIIYGMPQPTKLYTELQPLGEDALILYWAYVATMEMFDFDYVHYRTVIQESSKYFTALGHQNFIQALVDSKNLQTVKERNAVVIPQVTGKLQLVSTDMTEGHYTWNIKVPLQLTYASTKYETPIVQNLLADMQIARVNTLLSPFYGLAIFRLNFEEIVNTQNATATTS